MAKLLLGKEVTEALNERIRARAEALRAKGIVPKLAIIRCGEDPSDLSYERGAVKRGEAVGVETERLVLPADADKEAVMSLIRDLNGDDSVQGVLLFRPLPKHLREYESEICNTLRPEKDVDCMTHMSQAGVYENLPLGFPPCTPQAVMEILDHYGIDVKGKKAAVIGRSLVIGKPAAMMLMARHATVAVCHTRTPDVPAITKEADIIVTSAGVLGSLTGEFVRPGQTVIDVSINWDPALKEGKGGIAGDAVFDEVEKIAGAVTPVPGGVGAVTTSVLMEHVVTAAERAAGG
ncbi:MAG: bifunctional 5,10-methylenetetrahydrofolate dehydrogenase/5,10-methenyltetrahydrofolate cyclohydrolase [Lachnospiraceae bacterium]|nr:bifunctional 5,10-methylenetetrahydrofolate dehydrogenase/5,10-methenyltetrahydrofolate cyclohydrolase [Lachnospiraceae bacterium]